MKGNRFGARNGKDVFIDEDGDGICDRRGKGLGYGLKGLGKGKGKKLGKGNNN